MNMSCSDGELHCNGQTQPYIADISRSIPMMVAYRSCSRNPFTFIENHRSYMNCRWMYQCISSISRSYTSYIKYVKHKPQFYRCSPSKIPSMPSYTGDISSRRRQRLDEGEANECPKNLRAGECVRNCIHINDVL